VFFFFFFLSRSQPAALLATSCHYHIKAADYRLSLTFSVYSLCLFSFSLSLSLCLCLSVSLSHSVSLSLSLSLSLSCVVRTLGKSLSNNDLMVSFSLTLSPRVISCICVVLVFGVCTPNLSPSSSYAFWPFDDILGDHDNDHIFYEHDDADYHDHDHYHDHDYDYGHDHGHGDYESGGFAYGASVSYYDILGIKEDSSTKDIKRAFRKLSLKYHPDKNPGDAAAQEKFVQVQKAYDILSDPDKKHMYDYHGEEGVERYEKQQQQGQHGQQGGQMFDPFGFGGRQQQSGAPRGPDFNIDIEVTLEQLYLGDEQTFNLKRKVVCKSCKGSGAKGGKTKTCTKCKGRGVVTKLQQLGPGFNVQMQQPCPKCHGRGKTFKHKCPICHGHKLVEEQAELKATIEKGMPDGYEIRFPRMSEQSPDTIPGDVILHIKTKKHSRFKRRGNMDLLHTMTITLKEALLGFKKPLKQLDGRTIMVQRSDVTYPGQVMTIQDEGMPQHNVPSHRGVLDITFQIKFPNKLSSQQQEQLKKLLA
jgi:DnaJ-related protein SCJ1